MKITDIITEVFNSEPYPLRKEPGSAPNEFDYHAVTDDGRPIDIYFDIERQNDPNSKYLGVGFEVDRQHQVTGKGDALRILNTVLLAVNNEVKKFNPVYIALLADREHYGIYRALANRFGGQYQLLPTDQIPAMFTRQLTHEDPNSLFILKRKGAVTEDTLTELVGIKNKIKDLPKPRNSRFDPLGIDWHTALNNHGFRVMGYGSFGVVWENPKLPYVLKVFSANDSAYIDWISVARQNKNNPHMPRFVSARLLTITPEVLAIRMEKLSPVINQEKNVIYESSSLLQERYNPSEQIKLVGFDTDQRHLRYFCQTHPQWLPALDIVKNFSNNSGYRLDFHDKNIMVRGDDTLVITDPVYNREDLVGR